MPVLFMTTNRPEVHASDVLRTRGNTVLFAS
jgi:hypothetical protein